MLNASWLKILAFLGVWAVIWLPIASIVSRSIGWRVGQVLMPQQKLILIGSLYVLSPIIFGWKIKVGNLSFESLGLNLQSQIPLSIIFGLTLSLLSLVIIFGLESAFNLVTWDWSNRQQLFTSIVPILILSLFIGSIEEIVFRGYIFSVFTEDYSSVLAAIFSSLIFALLHLIWERKETLPQIPGLWLMGLILVGARVLDNNTIYLAIGLHSGWVWGLTCIDSANILTYKKDNSWVTGLNQQPLAGVAGISCLISVGFALWLIFNNNYVSVFQRLF